MLAATWVSAIASAGLLIGAIITAILAIGAYREQSEQLRLMKQQMADQAAADDSARTNWQWEYGSTIVAWTDHPGTPNDGQVHASGTVANTGVRPVRDVSVRWYLDSFPISEAKFLASCFLPGTQLTFSDTVRVPEATTATGQLNAVVQFRTLGNDWWRAGTDGGLASNTHPIGAHSSAWANAGDPWPGGSLKPISQT
jgi:hypothetical protein